MNTPPPLPPMLTLTQAAAKRLRSLLARANGGGSAAWIRVGVRSSGCSGFGYFVEYADERLPSDREVSNPHEIPLLVDAAGILFLLGSEMDWASDRIESRFVFNNPNEGARCGCGESFALTPADAPPEAVAAAPGE